MKKQKKLSMELLHKNLRELGKINKFTLQGLGLVAVIVALKITLGHDLWPRADWLQHFAALTRDAYTPTELGQMEDMMIASMDSSLWKKLEAKRLEKVRLGDK